MTLNDFVDTVVGWTRDHEAWAPALAFGFAFGESLVILSLVVPGSLVLAAVGALIGAGGIELWPIWLGAAAGATIGGWISYQIGDRYEERIVEAWPFNRYPEKMAAAHRFFERWGSWSVFLTRFLGPLHGVGPLIAGAFGTPPLLFHASNVASAMLWAFLVLAPAATAVRSFMPV
jgi:membrane protein DedA with SNARE-associated domain